MKEAKWVCNRCAFETETKPDHRNKTCQNCGKGRFRLWKLCECGKWFHPGRISAKYCSNECKYKHMPKGGKKGKHYQNAQRARIATCPVCKKQFRAVKDTKNREAVYCSKECWSKRGRKPRKKIIRTPEFIAWKTAVFLRDNHTCQACGATKNLDAHHIKEKRNYPELQYDVSNGVCLCRECHKKTDNYGQKAVKRWAVN